jgi:hypothetical protein
MLAQGTTGLVGADDRGSRRARCRAAVQAPEIAPFEPQHDIGLLERRISFFRGMRDFTNDALKDGSPALSRGPQPSDYESGGLKFESSGRAIEVVENKYIFLPYQNHPRLKIAFSLGFSLGKFFDTFRPFELCVHEPAHDFVSRLASSSRGNNRSESAPVGSWRG